MKIAELFWQLRGEAGARQVPGTPERGVAQAWGDLMQVGTVVVMGREGGPPTTATQLETSAPPRRRRRRSRTPSSARRTGAVEDAIGARYAWDAGVAIGRFLDGLRDGQILGRECRVCDRVLVPPRMFCERCFRGTDAWVRGRAHRRRADVLDLQRALGHAAARRARAPRRDRDRRLGRRVPAHARRGRRPTRCAIGMTVEAVWKPVGERTGSILDIAYFRPREERRRLMLEKIARPEEVRRWEGDLPVRHRYTPGVAGDAFFTALRSAACCSARGARAARTPTSRRGCSASGASRSSSADTEVGPGGELVSFTIVFRGDRGRAARAPVRRSAPSVSTGRTRS